MVRVLTAVVLIPIVLGIVLRADDWLFRLVVAAVALLALREFYHIAASWQAHPYRWVGGIFGALLIFAFPQPSPAFSIGMVYLRVDGWLILVPCIVALLLRTLSRVQHLRDSLPDAAITLLGIFYPVFLLALFADLRQMERGPWWIVYLLIVVWVGDIAAYYVGKNLGRHWLAPRVSPKKTWEGAIAGFVASVIIGGFLGQFARPFSNALSTIRLADTPVFVNAAFWQTALLAIPISVAAQLGDLVESIFKRGAGIKDSGASLPGHGGILDRIDAMLLATPVLWYYLTLRL